MRKTNDLTWFQSVFIQSMPCPIHSYESTSLRLLTTAFAPAAPPTSSAYLNPTAFLHNQVNRLSSEQYSQDAKVNLLAPQVYTQLPQAHLVSFPAPAAVNVLRPC